MYKGGNRRASFETQKVSDDAFTAYLRQYEVKIANAKSTKSAPSTGALSLNHSSIAELSTTSTQNNRSKYTRKKSIANAGSQCTGTEDPLQWLLGIPLDGDQSDTPATSECQRWQDRENVRNPCYSGSHMVMERRGGLTWIKSPSGVLVPHIENTWLKQMITMLLPDEQALSKFLKTLQTCLEEAVLFLYNEGIKPYLGDVANQMKRSIADNFWSASEVAFVSLHCKDTIEMKIEQRVKGEMGWVVYLRQVPPHFLGFVDTHSTIDPYSNYHWRALNKFAVDMMTANRPTIKTDDQGSETTLAFTGGRYAFAERLREKVHAFQSMRLGEVVHLVQLAIYSGVFVYAQRILLPVTACEKTAEEMFPRVKKVRHPVCSSLEEVRHIVSLLVDNRKNGLVLAQLKQQFMMQFNKELNPLSFGYRKLQNLLLSDNFNRQYQLFVPVDSPHRTHIQNRKYSIPAGCRAFKQSKLRFDIEKFWSPTEEWYDEPSCEGLTELPVNIRSALEEILDGEEDDLNYQYANYALPLADCLKEDDTSTGTHASNCSTGRGTTTSNTVDIGESINDRSNDYRSCL
ncbi:hypothetical protein, conserved [Babesia bigemina]|uniref:HTH OST-type domain-containing protein n=1 Tax=Babesia bigemina TaxID=5866 RepID=A0A061D8H4_BABBI|nr:hypothetical protein, conserved [Babesia bigemina]CDR96272.1 hypothetical protein, conserved [Babesia bigemina]|eukprot:XP_012768458.1 hypothetical protein, conserved [Babesia bigemina]